MSDKAKDLSIETLRGIAIILVVAGYITDDIENVHSVFSSAVRFGYYLLKPIRIPLFTVISAYLYASSPVVSQTFQKLITGKMRRILIPFFVVSAMQYVVFSLLQINGVHPISEILKIYIWPFEQFWFLWAVFWIFMAVGLLDSIKALDTKQKWLGCLFLSIVSHIAFEPTRMFAIHGINYLFPFFLLGYGLRRYSKELFSPLMIKSYMVTGLLAYVAYTPFYNKLEYANAVFKTLALAISFTAVPLIFHFKRALPWLAQIGYYAFGIHVFNKISSAAPRMLFQYFHITNDILIFIAYLSCGIFFAIGIQNFLERFSLTRQFILGIKDRPKQQIPSSVQLQPSICTQKVEEIPSIQSISS